MVRLKYLFIISMNSLSEICLFSFITYNIIFTSSFQRTREVAQRYGSLDFLEPIRVAFRLIRFSMIAAIDKMFIFALVNYFVDANILQYFSMQILYTKIFYRFALFN